MANREAKTDIQKAVKFLGISVAQLRKEVKQALIRAVANSLADKSLKEWQSKRGPGWGGL